MPPPNMPLWHKNYFVLNASELLKSPSCWDYCPQTVLSYQPCSGGLQGKKAALSKLPHPMEAAYHKMGGLG